MINCNEWLPKFSLTITVQFNLNPSEWMDGWMQFD